MPEQGIGMRGYGGTSDFHRNRPLDVFSQGVGGMRADAVDNQLYFHSNCLPSDLPSWTVYSNMTAIPLRRLSSSPLVS